MKNLLYEKTKIKENDLVIKKKINDLQEEIIELNDQIEVLAVCVELSKKIKERLNRIKKEYDDYQKVDLEEEIKTVTQFYFDEKFLHKAHKDYVKKHFKLLEKTTTKDLKIVWATYLQQRFMHAFEDSNHYYHYYSGKKRFKFDDKYSLRAITTCLNKYKRELNKLVKKRQRLLKEIAYLH